MTTGAFHHVTWQSARGGREADGEADFVLLHPGIGVVVLEVKGGRLAVEAGQWISVDRNGDEHRIKNPYEQATESKHTLRRKFEALRPALASVPSTMHGVVFPDVEPIHDLGPAGAFRSPSPVQPRCDVSSDRVASRPLGTTQNKL